MNYDDWKQQAPPSDIDFEKMTIEEQEEQEIYEQRLIIEVAKRQIKELIEISSQTQNSLITNKLKQIRL